MGGQDQLYVALAGLYEGYSEGVEADGAMGIGAHEVSSCRFMDRGILKLYSTSLGLFAVSTQLEGSSNFLSSLVQMTSLLSVLSCILCTFSAALLLRNHTNLAEAHAHDTVRRRSYLGFATYNLRRSSSSIKETISRMVYNPLRSCSHSLGRRSYGRSHSSSFPSSSSPSPSPSSRFRSSSGASSASPPALVGFYSCS
jgi:hypothetical protein